MTRPQYQAITSEMIPEVTLDDNAGRMRVIAGEFAGVRGPARTFTELNVWDVRLNAGASCSWTCRKGTTRSWPCCRASCRWARDSNWGMRTSPSSPPRATGVWLNSPTDVTLLALSGEPIEEPIVGYGPFVMNTRGEIVAAFNDLESGRFAAAEDGGVDGMADLFECSGGARIRGAHTLRGGHPRLRSRRHDSRRTSTAPSTAWAAEWFYAAEISGRRHPQCRWLCQHVPHPQRPRELPRPLGTTPSASSATSRPGRQLYGYYRNPYTDDPSISDAAHPNRRTVSNTAPLVHGGKLFSLKEDGLPHELDPNTLATRRPVGCRRRVEEPDLQRASQARSAEWRNGLVRVRGHGPCQR